MLITGHLHLPSHRHTSIFLCGWNIIYLHLLYTIFHHHRTMLSSYTSLSLSLYLYSKSLESLGAYQSTTDHKTNVQFVIYLFSTHWLRWASFFFMTHSLDRLHLSDFYLLFTWSCSSLVTVLTARPLLHWCVSCNCAFYSSSLSPSLVSLVSPSIDVKQRDPCTWRDRITHTSCTHCYRSLFM